MAGCEHNPSVASASAPVTGPLDPEVWVNAYGDLLLRHALARVRQREIAEDLVQEAFLAAWRSRERFAGKASEKTWLLQILRHKIADHYREQGRKAECASLEELAELEEGQFHRSLLGGAHWHRPAAPANWGHPYHALEQSGFWNVVHECAGRLPQKVARVFVMRELDNLESAEICRILSIKASHLFVMLHRARLAMRRCLELNWFRDRGRPGPPAG